MKHILITIILIGTFQFTKAQELEHFFVEITKTNGTTYNAFLYSFTTHALTVKPLCCECGNKSTDTLPYTEIKRIKVHKYTRPNTYKLAGAGAGLIIGEAIALNQPAPPPSNPDPRSFVNFDIDLSGIVHTVYMGAGACIGFSIGGVIDLVRRKKTVRIHGREDRFIAFTKKYKSK